MGIKSRDNFLVSACFGECANRGEICYTCYKQDKRRLPVRKPDADKIGCEAERVRLVDAGNECD